MDAFIVLAALRDGATSMVVLLGDWPPRCGHLGGPLCARIPMGDDEEVNLASHFNMDAAFCARMRAAIAAGLESVPVGVITTPGTKNPKYVATQPRPLASSLSDKEFV